MEVKGDNYEESTAPDFEQYLSLTGQIVYKEFIWISNGFKSLAVESSEEKLGHLVDSIYRKYIFSGDLIPCLSTKLYLSLLQILYKRNDVEAHIQVFDAVANEVEQYLDKVIFPQFLTFHLSSSLHQKVQACLKGKEKTEAIENSRVALSKSVQKNGSSKFSLPSVILNQDGLAPMSFKFQRQISNSEEKYNPSNPECFAKALCEKLEGLKTEQNLKSGPLIKNFRHMHHNSCSNYTKVVKELCAISCSKDAHFGYLKITEDSENCSE